MHPLELNLASKHQPNVSAYNFARADFVSIKQALRDTDWTRLQNMELEAANYMLLVRNQ